MSEADIRRIFRALVTIAAVAFATIAYVYLTLPDVRSLATTNPRTTAFMQLRAREAAAAGKPYKPVQAWIPYRRISQSLKRAVLVAEDDAFWQHEGIDVEQIRRSVEIDLAKGGAIRGGSTITQQLAKNLYLSPSRNPLRKVRELIIARRLEAELPKARIFEIYLNVIEWGDGIWGADAAARRYFRRSAASLSGEQAALLAAAIVNPRVLSPAHPNARLLRRQRIILSRMGVYEPPPPAPVSAPQIAPADDAPAPEVDAPAPVPSPSDQEGFPESAPTAQPDDSASPPPSDPPL